MSQPARYIYATLRAFAGDETSGGRSQVLILGSDGSEISWDGDRIRVVEPAANVPAAAPAPAPRDRIAAYVEAALASRSTLQIA